MTVSSQGNKAINGARPRQHRQRHLLQKAGEYRAQFGPSVAGFAEALTLGRLLHLSVSSSEACWPDNRKLNSSTYSPFWTVKCLEYTPVGFLSPPCFRKLLRSSQMMLLTVTEGKLFPSPDYT